MRFVIPLAATLTLLVLGSAPALANHHEPETHEYFICTLKPGKSIEDLMKVAAEFASAVAKLPGAEAYRAKILTPIASQDMSNVIWLGRMPSFSAMAAFSEAYQASDVGKALDARFAAVSECQSHSFWQAHHVK